MSQWTTESLRNLLLQLVHTRNETRWSSEADDCCQHKCTCFMCNGEFKWPSWQRTAHNCPICTSLLFSVFPKCLVDARMHSPFCHHLCWYKSVWQDGKKSKSSLTFALPSNGYQLVVYWCCHFLQCHLRLHTIWKSSRQYITTNCYIVDIANFSSKVNKKCLITFNYHCYFSLHNKQHL